MKISCCPLRPSLAILLLGWSLSATATPAPPTASATERTVPKAADVKRPVASPPAPARKPAPRAAATTPATEQLPSSQFGMGCAEEKDK
jgi:hypothetical protein